MISSAVTPFDYICGPKWDRRVVTISPPPQGVGILMSGGIDSWVLYSLLIKSVSPSQITIFNIKRPDGIDNSTRLELLTGRDDIVEIGMVDSVKHTIDVAIDTYPNIQMFTAVNVIPHTEYFPEFADDERPRRPWKIDWPSVSVPFHHLYKYHILDLAKSHNIDLTNTMSCTRSSTSHCNECWQCREKLWAFKQLEA